LAFKILSVLAIESCFAFRVSTTTFGESIITCAGFTASVVSPVNNSG